jgi:hypothetical protein
LSTIRSLVTPVGSEAVRRIGRRQERTRTNWLPQRPKAYLLPHDAVGLVQCSVDYELFWVLAARHARRRALALRFQILSAWQFWGRGRGPPSDPRPPATRQGVPGRPAATGGACLPHRRLPRRRLRYPTARAGDPPRPRRCRLPHRFSFPTSPAIISRSKGAWSGQPPKMQPDAIAAFRADPGDSRAILGDFSPPGPSPRRPSWTASCTTASLSRLRA